MIISRTPFRISFFGGGTDYPAWYLKHGGTVLSTAINKYCYITCRHLPPFFEHRYVIGYSKLEYCRTIDEISHPAVRGILQYLNYDRGLELHNDSDLPARSGMGSSSAFTVGFLHALYALKGQMVSKQQLAKESVHIEQQVLKETVGSQDQVQAAYGGFNHITFHSDGEITVRPVTITPERLTELNSHLMLFYTGIKRTASNIAESFVNGIEDKKRQLRFMKDLVEEGISTLNGRHDICGFGELLHEAWQAKRSLSTSVSNSDVDEMYDAARSSGAIGGKLTGAGGGGFLLLFVPPPCQEKIKEKLSGLIHVPFKFDFSGSQIIFFDQQEDYSAEERARVKQTIHAFRELLPNSSEIK
jgi:D-glycero-alpha-D-manno-heptose-7-phosphate kinase